MIEREPKNRRRWTLPAVGIVLAVGALVALLPVLRKADAGAPAGPAPSTSASAGVRDPFAGSVAASYPEGAAGITLPAAKAVKGFSAKEVAASLQKVRAAMIAGRLDRPMLVDHRPDAFLAMLARDSRERVSARFKDGTFGSIATWIAPTARLDPRHPARVSGRMTYAAHTVDGIRLLRITTNFVWVYGFQTSPPGTTRSRGSSPTRTTCSPRPAASG